MTPANRNRQILSPRFSVRHPCLIYNIQRPDQPETIIDDERTGTITIRKARRVARSRAADAGFPVRRGLGRSEQKCAPHTGVLW